MKKTILLLIGLFITNFSFTQTMLEGTVTEKDTEEPVLLANIAIYKNGQLITVTQCDFDGKYSVSLDAGTYEVEASYVGLQTERIKKVSLKKNKTHILDIKMFKRGIDIICPISIDYKYPLIQHDNMTSGATIFNIQRGRFEKSFTVKN